MARTTGTLDAMRARTIAIDGPAASGKSAVGRALAARLGYRFLDTGALYRAITWLALRRGVPTDDAQALAALAESARIEVRDADDALQPTAVVVDGVDATPHLRDADVEEHVSEVSRVPGVRHALVRVQRELATDGPIVMAGRDIGTVVLPDAALKVYLDASPRVRAHRRAEQLRAMGQVADEVALEEEIRRRDAIDSSREASPLTAAPDAVKINTDDLTVEEVVRRLVDAARG